MLNAWARYDFSSISIVSQQLLIFYFFILSFFFSPDRVYTNSFICHSIKASSERIMR